MQLLHKDYLQYELPDFWHSEEENDFLNIYDPNGEGAITISFLNIISKDLQLETYICSLAKQFVDLNKIELLKPLILYNREDQLRLHGYGFSNNKEFIKIWIVAKYPKVVFATYYSATKTKEVDVCDSIIESMKFLQ